MAVGGAKTSSYLGNAGLLPSYFGISLWGVALLVDTPTGATEPFSYLSVKFILIFLTFAYFLIRILHLSLGLVLSLLLLQGRPLMLLASACAQTIGLIFFFAAVYRIASVADPEAFGGIVLSGGNGLYFRVRTH